MLAKLCLITCVLSLAQPGDRNLWALGPQFGQGQELVYSGSYTEESLSGGVEYRRRYLLQTRAIVLDATPKGWSVGLLTSLQLHRDRPAAVGPPQQAPVSVRLELADVDQQGRVGSHNGVDLLVPLDGPPTVELGCLVAVPPSRVGVNHQWACGEPGRPPLTWRILGTEVISSTLCIRIEGKQQSPDWNSPRSDSTAWQRTELVWLAPQTGIAYRVKRVIERREPARQQPTQRSIVQYELDGQLSTPPRLFGDRRSMILQVARFGEEAERLISRPNDHRNELEALLQRIERYLQSRQGQPDAARQALEQVKHRIEAVRRGEVVATPTAPATTLIPVAQVGQRAPDFLANDLIHKQSVQLYRQLGRPVLILFYNPKTDTGRRVLAFARKLQQDYRGRITILGMAVTDDVAFVQQQCHDLDLTFPVLDGKGLHRTFGVSDTPRMVLLDQNGIMRAGYTGWGVQVPGDVLAELNRCLARKGQP
jgi:peroxiredoxin